MTHTTNLNLNKPDLNDNVNVATDINDNMDLIDAAYGNMRDDFGDVYDPTATYAKDDICIYNNVLYQANTAINTPEAWNASHWDAKSVADLVGALNSKIENITTKGSWTTITVDSNNTYTIPYDGVLYITCGTSDNNDGYLTYNISTWRTIRLNVFGQLSAYQYIPVAQGDVIAFDNKSSNITDILLQYRRM